MNGKKIILTILIILIILAATAGGLFLSGKLPLDWLRKQIEILQKEPTAMAGQDAEALALEKAKEWQPDAALAYMESGSIGQTGRAKSWRLIFTSANVKQKSFEVKISEKQIVSAVEIDYAGQGQEFPASTKISQEQAVQEVKNMLGYKDAEILGVDAVYGKGTGNWYWGVRTSKGTVSVKMGKK